MTPYKIDYEYADKYLGQGYLNLMDECKRNESSGNNAAVYSRLYEHRQYLAELFSEFRKEVLEDA